jgi:hypothetical protein
MILASPKRESAGIHILSPMVVQISDRDLSCISKTMEPHGCGMDHWAPSTQLQILAADLAIDQGAQVLAIGVLILGGLKGACQRNCDPAILLFTHEAFAAI